MRVEQGSESEGGERVWRGGGDEAGTDGGFDCGSGSADGKRCVWSVR